MSLRHYLRHPRTYYRFWQEYRQFRRANDGRFVVSRNDIFPCVHDRTATTPFDAHYVYHPAWAARMLAEHRTQHHVDISSTLHFCSIVSAFLPVDFYDFRPANIQLNQLTSGVADLTALPFPDNGIASLSCMHTVEHIGLGRYGDPIDPRGDIQAMKELTRVLAPGGRLLFVVPIGKMRLVFNAHRIYSYRYIIEQFPLHLKEFSLVTDAGGFIRHATESQSDAQTYGCGCFLFEK